MIFPGGLGEIVFKIRDKILERLAKRHGIEDRASDRRRQ